MTYQEREKFANWLLDRYLRDDTIDGIMAEYDRLTERVTELESYLIDADFDRNDMARQLNNLATIKAQLLEACKRVKAWDDNKAEYGEFDMEVLPMVETAIRAAEEYQA